MHCLMPNLLFAVVSFFYLSSCCCRRRFLFHVYAPLEREVHDVLVWKLCLCDSLSLL